MNYFSNPIHTVTMSAEFDPVAQSRHNGKHVLFYCPSVPITDIKNPTPLSEFTAMVNRGLDRLGVNTLHHNDTKYFAANMVRINMYYHSLLNQGSVKPMLLHWTGGDFFGGGTGGTRLMAAELIPHMTTVAAFIDTTTDFADKFKHCTQITSFREFATYFAAQPHTQFYFRITDPNAGYGLDWYEVALEDAATTVADENWCVQVLENYLKQQPDNFRFEPSWFCRCIDWSVYQQT